MKRILLVDLSSVFYPIWHMSGKEPDVDHSSRATVGKVRALASGFDHVAVCCDSGRSFRKDIDESYKATRPEKDERLLHQLRLARETLETDGFAVWAVKGAEADDIIASAVELAKPLEDVDVVIASSDKDLLQLVDERVTAKSLTSGNLLDPIAVKEKLGVDPKQVRDFLVLVGDKSDNIKGVPGIGEKRAAELLQKHGSLLAIVLRIGEGAEKLGMTPAIYKALCESTVTMELGRQLVSLKTDVPIPFDDIFKPRVPKDAIPDAEFTEEESMETIEHNPVTGEVTTNQAPTPVTPTPVTPTTTASGPTEPSPSPPPAEVMASGGPEQKIEPVVTSLTTVRWQKELEPRSFGQAIKLATFMHQSRLFSAYGTPQAVLSTILAGRELGIGAMASLRGFHIIDGKPSMSSGLMAALVLQSGKAAQFSCIKRSNESATVRAWRIGEPDALDITYTIEDARLAELVKAGGGWVKNPADMCVARATAIGARLKFQDVCFGLYTPEELGREDLELEAA